jgi:hypothetical protein
MSLELEIKFEGEAPDLAEHRLSVARFGEALNLLLQALRRTASAIITEAVEHPAYGRRGGKYAEQASQIDLQIREIGAGSLVIGFETAMTPGPGEQVELFADFPEKVLAKVLDDIDAEVRGELRNYRVRRYLTALPADIRHQTYSLRTDGKSLRVVEFGESHLPEVPKEPPKLYRLIERLTSVGFDPGGCFVGITSDGRTLKASATNDQVDVALQLRTEDVEAAVLVHGNSSRLLWLRRAKTPLPVPDPAERIRYLHSEWHETLEELSK